MGFLDVEFDKVSGKYYPIIFLNDYWNLHEDYMPINSTLSHVNLTLTFSHLQLWKWQMYLSQSMKNQWYGGMLAEDSSDEDQDTIKVFIQRLLNSTRPTNKIKHYLNFIANIVGYKSLFASLNCCYYIGA